MNSILCGVAGVLAFSSLAQASLVSIDFNTSTPASPTYSGSGVTVGGLEPLAGQIGAWNVLDLGPSNVTTGLSTPLVLTDATDGEGNSTTIDFTLNTNSQVIKTYNAAGPDVLGSDFAFVESNALVGWAFAGLEAGAQYTIRFFGQVTPSNDAVNFARVSLTDGPPGSYEQGGPGQNYVTLDATADEFGVITGAFGRTNPDVAGPGSVSGVQIALVPEPASLALIGLGTLLMVRPRASRHG